MDVIVLDRPKLSRMRGSRSPSAGFDTRCAVDHSGNPTSRKPSAQRAKSSGRRSGTRTLMVEMQAAVECRPLAPAGRVFELMFASILERTSNWSCAYSLTRSDAQMPPGSAIPSRRTATFTPLPNMSPLSMIMSPKFTSMRNSIRFSSSTLAFRSAMPRVARPRSYPFDSVAGG